MATRHTRPPSLASHTGGESGTIIGTRMAAVDDSLARLRTDHVDLDYAHYDEDVAIED